MAHLTGADWAIFAMAGWLAVTALVRLMNVRRTRLVAEFRQQMAEEQRRQRQAEQAAKKPAAKKAA